MRGISVHFKCKGSDKAQKVQPQRVEIAEFDSLILQGL